MVGSLKVFVFVIILKLWRLSLIVNDLASMFLFFKISDTSSAKIHKVFFNIFRSETSVSKVVSLEILFLTLEASTFLSSMPFAKFQIVNPYLPNLLNNTSGFWLTISSILKMEFFSNFFWNFGPIPGIFLICSFFKNSDFSEFLITVNPFGLLKEDASFDKNLF